MGKDLWVQVQLNAQNIHADYKDMGLMIRP